MRKKKRCCFGYGKNEITGESFDSRLALKAHLESLSTYGRFVRFAKDFRKKEGYKVEFEETTIDDVSYIRISLRDVAEFLSRTDYTDNWQSEMHETFCFWDFDEWKLHLEEVGFKVHPDSKAFSNP
jgi:hypothetical protein